MASPTAQSPRIGGYQLEAFDFGSSPFSTRGSSNDACLVSADGHILYVDRFLLTYVSPVFKDMYELSTSSSNVDAEMPYEAKSVNLVEDAETLDALFRHADPKHTPPRLSIGQLFAVIQAAQKYQMDGSLSRLRSSLTAPCIIRSPSPSPTPISQLQAPRMSSRPINLIVSNPLPVAVLAHTFSFYEELRMAMRELARIHIDLIVRNEQECLLPAVIFQYILQLRRQRSIWFKAKARLINQYPISSPPSGPSTPTSSSFFGGGAGYATPRDCTQCMRYRANHIHDACVKVDDQPSWGTFKAEIQRTHNNTCSCGALNIPTNIAKFNVEFNKWEEEAKLMETELPEWPPSYMTMNYLQKSF
jgi:hypothetical protein